MSVKLSDVRKHNRPYHTPDPSAPATYQRDIYASFQRPLFSTKPHEWEALARAKVHPENFGYVFGSASQARTHAGNVAAFDRYRLRPAMLADATRRDLSVTLFGATYPTPLLAAPVGVQNIMHADGEEATARACRRLRVPLVLSTAATRSIEQVAEAHGEGQPRWFQLYWPKPQEECVTASLLARARQSGYGVLVVTLDTFTLGWRPEDLDGSYLPFIWGEGCQIGFSDPVFQERYAERVKENAARPVGERAREAWEMLGKIAGNPLMAAAVVARLGTVKKALAWLDVMNSGTYRQWEHLKILRELWGAKPIVLKGIQTVADARRAVEMGMDGIIVSNHGGRQCDGAIASLDALAEITADEVVKQSGITVLFDSGVRTGADVLKAMALGAKAVLIGRPYMYGLAIRGQAGVEHVFKCILSDTDNTLANMGKASVRDLSRADLQIRSESKL